MISKYTKETKKPISKTEPETITKEFENNIDFHSIFNMNDYNLNARNSNLISNRISFSSKPDLQLQLWTINSIFSPQIATSFSVQLCNEFMNESMRDVKFLFAYNQGNEKIRGNEYIGKKMEYALNKAKYGYFSYAKYEYKREEQLYIDIQSYLNSTFMANIVSVMVNDSVIGVSDLFISVYFENNFLTMHNDMGLGHYAFVIFLSQNWEKQWGGTLNMNCKGEKYISCLEIEHSFNKAVFFKVWPNSVQHFVSKVVVTQPRIAITGWYFTGESAGVYWNQIHEEIGYGLK